jgi:predicted dehydrogenase
MNPLRTAILGCGGFARRHAQLLSEMPEQANLVAFCDRNLDRAESYAADFTDGKAAVFTDHHRLIDEAQLDLLVICLPPYGHSDEVAYAASKGVHIFIEKPIALTSEQAWEMVEAVEKAGIVTQVGFMFRFGAAVARLKQLIDSGEAGPFGLMTARYFCNSLHAGWWRERDRSGGQLVEQVIHMVDLMRYLLGDASTVYSLQQNLFHRETPNYTVEDVSGTVFGFANGGIGTISATNGAIPGRWTNDYRVVTQNVTAEFTDANHATLVHTAGASAESDLRTEIVASDQDVYKLEFLDIIDAIRAGRPAAIPMREGAKSLGLALAATRSAETGLPERVE